MSDAAKPMYEDVKNTLADARSAIYSVEEQLPHGDMRRRLYRVRCDLGEVAHSLLNSDMVKHRTPDTP